MYAMRHRVTLHFRCAFFFLLFNIYLLTWKVGAGVVSSEGFLFIFLFGTLGARAHVMERVMIGLTGVHGHFSGANITD